MTQEPLPTDTDVQTVKQMLDRGDDFVLVDCREPDEHATARIDGSRLIPMSELQARIEELQAIRDKHLVIHCHLGGRSHQVTQWLRGQGFPRVQNMAGGIDAWSLEIDDTVPRY